MSRDCISQCAPNEAAFVLQCVDAMVAGSNGARLIVRHLTQQGDQRDFVPHGTVEQIMVDILSVEAAKAKADICGNVSGNLWNAMANIIKAEVKPHREILSEARDRVERV